VGWPSCLLWTPARSLATPRRVPPLLTTTPQPPSSLQDICDAVHDEGGVTVCVEALALHYDGSPVEVLRRLPVEATASASTSSSQTTPCPDPCPSQDQLQHPVFADVRVHRGVDGGLPAPCCLDGCGCGFDW
jgi:hypothetical protein